MNVAGCFARFVKLVRCVENGITDREVSARGVISIKDNEPRLTIVACDKRKAQRLRMDVTPNLLDENLLVCG